MSHGSRLDRTGRTRRAPARPVRPSCEGLEGRALMSVFSLLFPKPPSVPPTPKPSSLPSQSNGRVTGLFDLSRTGHPPYQSVTDGHVLKAPMFPASYRGPKSEGLDVVGASARFDSGQGFALRGQLLGAIDGTRPAVYTFLVDRGGAPTPGLIRIRPRIVYDAEVTVSVGPTGQAGSVSLLDAQGQAASTVPLPAEAVRVRGASVKVAVPADLLPATGPARALPGKGYRFTFAAGVPGSGGTDLSGFAPEYVPATIATSPGPQSPARVRVPAARVRA